MRRLALLIILLAPATAFAQKAETEVLHDGSFVVSTDVELAPEKAKAVLDRVKAAWEYVSSELDWKEKDVLARDVKLHVLDDASMKTRFGAKVKGHASGKDDFFVARTFLDEERSARTLAHELTHLQDRRHLETKGARLPHWLTEGRAVTVGRGYEAKLGISDKKYGDDIARVASDVSPAEAKRILEDDAYVAEKKMPSIFRMEAAGFFFLEFVRVKLQVEDLEKKLGRVVARVGKGATLEDAFEAEVGTKLSSARSAFYEYLEDVKGPKRLEWPAVQRH